MACADLTRPIDAMKHRVARTLALLLLPLHGCGTTSVGDPPLDSLLAIGTWGGTEAGVLVTDTLTHVHVGCTYGDIRGRVTLDADGRFTRGGTYVLRAYPVAIGPTMPAVFSGRVLGQTLTISVAVRDTIAMTDVSFGPVTVRLGTEPTMANCPICRVPGDRSSARGQPSTAPAAATARATSASVVFQPQTLMRITRSPFQLPPLR